MDDVNLVVDTKLFPEIPPEAWGQLTAGPETVKKFGGIDGVKAFWLEYNTWEDERWKPKKNEAVF